MDKLLDLAKRCQLDAGKQPAKFVFLGDYIDRGPDSRGVVEFLIEVQSQQPGSIICLAGNHEGIALAAVHAGQHELWLRNGGGETLRSYGAGSAADLPSRHVGWLNSLPALHDDAATACICSATVLETRDTQYAKGR